MLQETFMKLEKEILTLTNEVKILSELVGYLAAYFYANEGLNPPTDNREPAEVQKDILKYATARLAGGGSAPRNDLGYHRQLLQEEARPS
jgi:hypothetical protein